MTSEIHSGDITLSGRYRLGDRIAVGGMGEVWGASDLLLHREVAIKLLKAEYLADPGFLERFRTEARHTASLSHSGIATVYDYGEVNGAPYLVMELVRGEPLSSILARAGALPVGQALDIAAQTARALGSAHAAGVVHRDVKPGNILVCPDGVVKVTDFGIARAMDASSLTQTGTVIGTANYMSPEQASGARCVPASDLYSLGVVTYEMVAGVRPFAVANPVAVALAHLRDEPDPLPAGTPEPVRALIMRALAKRPADRYADAAAFATAAAHAAAANELVRHVGPQPANSAAAGGAGATRVLALQAERGAVAKRRPAARWVALAAALVLFPAAIALLTRGGNTKSKVPAPKTTAAPITTAAVSSAAPSSLAAALIPANLVGMTYDQAAAVLVALQLKPARFDVLSPAAVGMVIGTQPGAGTVQTPGTKVTLFTSAGPNRKRHKKEEND